MYRIGLILFIFLLSLDTIAQRGKDGAKVISGTEVVNAYTLLTANASAGDFSITVANNNLATAFLPSLSQGDLIMIYQAQNATVEDSLIPWPNPQYSNSSKFFDTWGQITSYDNSGNYEFVQVDGTTGNTVINLDCALQNDYDNTNCVIIRVPRYSSLTITGTGVMTCNPWDGVTGGVLAVEVLGTTDIQAGGRVDASTFGFRGGVAVNGTQSSVFGGLRYADANVLEGAQKGEGIAGDQIFYGSFNDGGARQCRGAAANAGGGGNAHNAGGGGGANAGDINGWNNGVGNPDVSQPNYVTAWNLDTSFAPNALLVTSSGGGRGGYSILRNDRNELLEGPNNTNWGGDNRRDNGGLGGRPLDYSTGKIFLGGGGGAGEGDNGDPTDGGDGGGIIFMMTYGDITGAGDIISNGEDGEDVNPGSAGIGQLEGVDGAGGAGAGGTIILQTTGTVSLTGNINANGGEGGDQILVAGLFATIDEAEGPGGGGGGGYIAISAGAPTRNTNGGANGETNSPFVSNFPANGATIGGVGINNANIDAWDIVVSGDSICENTTSTLTASLSGNPPGGTSFEWFDAQFGGTLLFTGASFTTPSLTTTTTYWVRVCPAPYLVPVTVIVTPCPTTPIASFSATDSTLCVGDCIDFTDLSTNSPTGWSWHFFGAATTTSSVQNPTNICYNSAGTFDVALVATNASGSDSLFMPNFITVSALPTVTASNDTSICIGDTANISVSGTATSYSWDNGLGIGANFSVTPGVNKTYIVTGTDANNCVAVDSVIVSINALPTVTASNDTSICLGDTANISVTGSASSYSWDNGLGIGTNFSVTPGVNTTYIVTGTDVNSCVAVDSVIVTVNPLPNVVASNDTAICLGDVANLSASGATNYNWDNGLGAGQNQTPSPIVNTTYIVSGTDGNGCSAIDSVVVTINPLPNVIASNDTTICLGDPVNLSATGATNYNWDNGLGAGQNQSPSPITNTTYIVTGTDGNGCSNTDTVVVTVSNCATPPVVSFSSSDSTICIGDCIDFTDLSTNGPTTWTWYFFGSATPNSGLQNPTNICYNTAGTFDVALVASNPSGQDSLFMANFITVSALPTVVASNDTAICADDNANISVSGSAATYSWNNGLGIGTNFSVNPGTNTTYIVTGTDANNCVAIDSVIVTVNPLPTVIASNDTAICFGDSATISVSGTASTYSWDNGLGAGASFMVAPNSTTTYIVTGTDANSCSAIDSVIVTINPLPTVIASNDTTICTGDAANISAAGATTYSWNNGLGAGQNQSPSPVATTTYIVTGTDANGCTNTDSVVVTVTNCNVPPIAAMSVSSSALCINDCVDFTDMSTGGTPTTWNWIFEGGNPGTSTAQNPMNICYDTVGTYNVSLMVSNAFGQDSIYNVGYITVDSCGAITETLVIPNVFSPNGDFNNDLFQPLGNNILTLEMEIYNRWGELLFKTDQVNAGWNGRTTAGAIVPDGTYFYIIVVNGELYKGTITLIR